VAIGIYPDGWTAGLFELCANPQNIVKTLRWFTETAKNNFGVPGHAARFYVAEYFLPAWLPVKPQAVRVTYRAAQIAYAKPAAVGTAVCHVNVKIVADLVSNGHVGVSLT
jgi:hypothetical protein